MTFKLLEVNWQEVAQLFNRGGGQWLYMGIFYSYNFHRCLARRYCLLCKK